MPRSKLRLAMVTTFPPSTGTLNEYAWHMVRALREKSELAELILLADELPSDLSELDDTAGLVPVRIRRCWRFNAHDNAQRLVEAVREEQPDAVLFNIQFASFGDQRVPAALGLRAPALIKRTGVPTIVLLHNLMDTVDLRQAGFAANPVLNWLTRQAGAIMTRQLLNSDLVAVTIPRYVEILEQRYNAQNVLLAPHGAFEVPPPPQPVSSAEPLRVMAFGKFGTYKKVETLIEAFAVLQARNLPPLELVIAGSDSPNAAGYLERMQQQYAHVPNVRFTGYVAEEAVPALFTESAVVVFPYTSTTGSSGVLHQAGSYGKAAVLPRLGDLADLVAEEGFAGEFFTPDDVISLAAALERVLVDAAYRDELGMRNYYAACGLPIADVADWYLLHLETLMAAAPAQGALERRLA